MMESESLASSSPSKPWSETWKGRIVVIAGVFALFAMVFWMAMKSRRMLVPTQALVVDKQHLSFGEIWESKDYPWEVVVKNVASHEVEIINIATSCTCVSATPKQFAIPAGQNTTLYLKLDLTKGQERTNALTSRPFEVKVDAMVKELGRSINYSWTIGGKIREALKFDRRLVDFERSLIFGEHFPAAQCVLIHDKSIKNLKINSSSTLADVSIVDDVINADGRAQIRITPKKSITAGEWEFDIYAEGKTMEGKTLIGKSLPIRMHVLDKLIIEPSEMSLGAYRIGSAIKKRVLLQSLAEDKASIVLQGFSVSDMSTHVEPLLDRHENALAFQIIQHVNDLGFHESSVNFVVVAGDNRRHDVRLKITWHGIK